MLTQLKNTKMIEFLSKGSSCLGDEYSESSKSFDVNEDDVASLLNLENMSQREAPLKGHNSWWRKECDLQDPEGVFLARGHMMAFDPREAIMDNILEDDHVNLTILYYLKDISTVMTIWKWLLA
jgi:hypothetical protein